MPRISKDFADKGYGTYPFILQRKQARRRAQKEATQTAMASQYERQGGANRATGISGSTRTIAQRSSAGRPRAAQSAPQSPWNRRALIGGGILLALLALIWIMKGGAQDVPTAAAVSAQTAQAAFAPQAASDAEGDGEAPDAEASAPQPTPSPEAPAVVNYDRASTRPTATAPGFIPVYRQAKTTEKIVCITVDDCYQAENLQKIVDKALEVGGKLTIFPIGQNVIREKQAEILKYAWENGFELENHTYTHNNLYRCSDDELAREVYTQQLALSYILGVEYQCHFLRPMGGDARHDQRMQKYAEQMGYYGVAYWSYSGSDAPSRSALVKALEPGAIFLFHTTPADTETLMEFIPWVVEQGYTLVTMNEMFDLPENETKPLTAPIDKARISAYPTLAPYERVLVTYKNRSYGWGVYLLQQRLKELGYLKRDPDGVYGDSCEKAVKAFQKDHGLKQTGIADVETQEKIFGK